MYQADDTIAAIASAPAGAARGIVRISGPATLEILERCFRGDGTQQLAGLREPTAVSGAISLGGSQAAIVSADVYYWPDERSYTRAPSAELHLPGSPPLVSAALARVCAAGARLAEPGEFTLRAFLAGRLDLTQAEAVLGVIDSAGDEQLRTALAQLAGGLSRPLGQLRETLLDLLAELEAGLDFVEEDIAFVTRDQVARQLDDARALLASTGRQLLGRRRSDALPRVVLAGWPNVGKSSLFNALAAGSGALVSDVPGTTRDYLTATLRLGSLDCELVDTAGHEPAGAGDIAQQAQLLAAGQARTCDVELLCLDATRPPNAWELGQLAVAAPGARLIVLTKCDRPRGAWEFPPEAIATSAAQGAGLDVLGQQLAALLADAFAGETAVALTAERSGESIRLATAALERAATLCAAAGGEELIAAELRTALGELGKVVGAVYTDDILDRIFSRFCIGK